MAVIVRIKTTGERGALVGTGFGAFYTGEADRLYGRMMDKRSDGKIALASIALADGRLTWAYTHDVEVLSIDGVSPAEALQEPQGPVVV